MEKKGKTGSARNIAVITSVPSIRNYGSYFQAYATQRLLEKRGYKVELISYSRPCKSSANEAWTVREIAASIKGKKIFQSLPGMFRYIAAPMLYPSVSRQMKSFSAFAERYLHVTSAAYLDENSLKANPPQADIYCTGGDQMWNEHYNGHKTMREYYLSWAPEGKPRISLCTSIGKDRFDEWEKEEVRELLSKYSLISVREDSGKKAIEELGIENVYHLQDPVILLAVEEWEALAAPRVIKEKYILLYELSREAPLADYARELARRTGLKVVRINFYSFQTLRYGKSIMAPALEQFLSLFRYAEYVITNSFHGTAFSIAFGRKFASVAGDHPGRLQSVLGYYGLTDRICGAPAEIYDVINQPIDHADVEKKLSDARKDFDEYMNKVSDLL